MVSSDIKMSLGWINEDIRHLEKEMESGNMNKKSISKFLGIHQSNKS